MHNRSDVKEIIPVPGESSAIFILLLQAGQGPFFAGVRENGAGTISSIDNVFLINIYLY
jgi:hypothetical protein